MYQSQLPKQFVQQLTGKSKLSSTKPTERASSDQLLDLNKGRMNPHANSQHPGVMGKKLSKTQPTDPQYFLKDHLPSKPSSTQPNARSHSDTQHYLQQASNQKSTKRVQSSTSQKQRQSPQPGLSLAQSQLLKQPKKQTSYQSFFAQQLAPAPLQTKSQTLLKSQYSSDSLPVQPKLPLKQRQNQPNNIVIQPPTTTQKPQASLNLTQPIQPTRNTQQQKSADTGNRKFLLKAPAPRRQEFLNVDAKTNRLLLDLIKPYANEYDFDSFSKFVINASELTNQELFKELYQNENHQQMHADQFFQKEQLSTLVQQAIKDNFKHSSQAGKNSRSRNPRQQPLKAGQSVQTLSFVETCAHKEDGDDLEDFYTTLKLELAEQTDDIVYSLMSDYQAAKYSSKHNGVIAGYGANTNQGISRNYNEDRVAIILNIMKPKQKQFEGTWPKCSFFGVYDGHGGNACADFLRDYLHQLIIKDEKFPENPIQAIRNGFAEAEKLFINFSLEQEQESGEVERSGSCATCMLVVNDTCYIANTGDSRAVMSVNGGRQVLGLSNDHKPTDPIEVERILRNGGQIYQNASVLAQQHNTQVILGPHRVFPGRLSVCRTFGDVEAKAEHLLGNPKVVIADPDISFFKVDKNQHDFVLLGCDGIFDKLDNKDVVHTVWQKVVNKENCELQKKAQEQGDKNADTSPYHHQMCGQAVDAVLKSTAIRRSADNITVVMIAFNSFFQQVQKSQGNLTAFEHKQLEIQEIDLIQPPGGVDQSEILIDDAYTSGSSLNYGVVGDTGDHSFSKKPENLSEIQEEDIASMISGRLGKPHTQSTRSNTEGKKMAKRPSSSKSNTGQKKQMLEPVKSIGKLQTSVPAPQHKLQTTTAVQNSRSLPKYLGLSMEEQATMLSQTMPYTQPAGSTNQKTQSKSQKPTRNFYQQDQFNTEQQQPQKAENNITILKPGSAKRRKVFVKTIAQQQNQTNLASQFLSQVKQQNMQNKLIQQQSQGQLKPKSRNPQYASYLQPKPWASLNETSQAAQAQQILNTFQNQNNNSWATNTKSSNNK